MVGSILIASLFLLLSVNHITGVYIEQTEENMIDLKKTFLHDTINNLVNEIDAERKVYEQVYVRMVERQYSLIRGNMDLSDEDFLKLLVNYFEMTGDEYWTILIWEQESKQAVFDPANLVGEQWEGDYKQFLPGLLSYKIIRHGKHIILYGVSQEYSDNMVKEKIESKIRNSKYEDNAYIWVNEIINYQGGDNYAIRRVHPNLPETEGTYLSTDMTDIKGNFPYLTELEGINKGGEIYFTYFFKKLNSEVVSEKLAYAKAYRDFDWVIAMGIHLDDIQVYIDKTNEDNQELINQFSMILIGIFAVLLIVSFLAIINFDKWVFRHKKKALEQEARQDSLTKAINRRGGIVILEKAFKEYKKSGEGPAIMMFDIDHFKQVNDTFGHDVGDQVLQKIVERVNHVIRSSDAMIRWGGDEFIGVFHGLSQENAQYFAQKLLSSVSEIEIECEGSRICPTISLGIAYFSPLDDAYTEVVKRADEALYQSKNSGRNCANLIT